MRSNDVIMDKIELKENEEGNKGKHLFRFTNINEYYGNEKEISLLGNGKELVSSKKCSNALITCKNAFHKGSIHEFMVKRVKGTYPTFLGIVERYNSDVCEFSGNTKCVLSYFYGGKSGYIRWCKGGKDCEMLEKTEVPWKIGETVKMKVDLINWEITFYKSRTQIGKSVSIEERCLFPGGRNITRGDFANNR